jgi:dTMP kinase
MFIQIEGIDGAGKTTQCDLLREYMAASSIPAVVVKELDSTEFGKKIREILLHGKMNAAVAEMFLFLASKAQAFSEIILPHQAKGECVIADRGHGSFISYNASIGISKELLMEFLNVAHFGVMPDLTVLLDVPVGIAKRRLKSRKEKSRFDLLDEFHMERQRRQFLLLAESMPNWIVIDGTQEKEIIHKQIEKEVSGRQ